MKKIKKQYIYIIIILIIIFIIFTPRMRVELKTTKINVNGEYKLDYKVKYKNKDITNDTEVTSKIDNTKLGKYEVIFKYQKYSVIKKVKVVDMEAPKIELIRGESITVAHGNNFKDPGYNVSDNYDQNIKVDVSGNVDTSNDGEYELTYRAKDSTGNESVIKRKVNVNGVSPLDMSVKDFTLDGYFEKTILPSTPDAGEEYINKIIFAGDSVPLYYVMSGHIKGSQLWHKEGLNVEAALIQKIYIAHQTTDLTFVDAFRKYQPEIVILNLGMNSAGTMTDKYFIECYKKLINQIKDVSPNTKLIIQSIPPIDGSLDESEDGLTNKKINTFNYRIAEMCDELNIPFLNSAVVLKDNNGQCKKGYCFLEKNNYGVHQTKEGNELVFKYIRTHAINQ